jgi:integrase/recombinase XerC
LLNSSGVTKLSELSKLSKSYISQVKCGKRPPSEKLLGALELYQPSTTANKNRKYLTLFLQSRQAMGVTTGTMNFYRTKLGRFSDVVTSDNISREDIEHFLIQFNNPGNRHAYFRAIRTFFNWREEYAGLPSPMEHMRAPKLPKLMLPSLSADQVSTILQNWNTTGSSLNENKVRNQAIIAVFVESGVRLSELTAVKIGDIDWKEHTIKIMGKGRKEALAPFGPLTDRYLKAWLDEYDPNNGNVWGLNNWGVISMLRRLKKETGLPCNPHTFRRTFACLLRKAGLDTMTIKDLGRWESLEMVQRYTRTITFQDNLKFYTSLKFKT